MGREELSKGGNRPREVLSSGMRKWQDVAICRLPVRTSVRGTERVSHFQLAVRPTPGESMLRTNRF